MKRNTILGDELTNKQVPNPMPPIKRMTETRQPSTHSPFHAGLQAARANIAPGIFIWLLMLAVVLAYYHHASTQSLLETIADLKGQLGFGFSFMATGLAGGVFPEILKVFLLQNRKLQPKNVRNMAFGFPLWGMLGCSVDALYRMQAIWFGSEASAAVLVKKVVVDQFIFTPLWGTAAIVWSYEWRRRGFRPHALRDIFTFRFYRARVFPSLIAGWGVWIPAVSIVYSLPTLLQIPLFVLATCFWSLIVTFIASSHGETTQTTEAPG